MGHLKADEDPNSYLCFQPCKNPLKYGFRFELRGKQSLFEPETVKPCLA